MQPMFSLTYMQPLHCLRDMQPMFCLKYTQPLHCLKDMLPMFCLKYNYATTVLSERYAMKYIEPAKPLRIYSTTVFSGKCAASVLPEKYATNVFEKNPFQRTQILKYSGVLLWSYLMKVKVVM